MISVSEQEFVIDSRRCPLCNGPCARVMLDLGDSPLGDRFCETKSEARALETLPLKVGRCRDCAHIYLLQVPDADATYMNYLFTTSSSPGLSQAMTILASELIQRHQIQAGDLVIDVGTNDGTWLLSFRDIGCEVIGVEPAPMPAARARAAGIDVIQDYFSFARIQEAGHCSRAPRLISLNFMFANVPNPSDLLQEVARLAGPQTVVSVLTGYHPAQLAVGMFDYINHDHLSYFTCADFVRLASDAGLAVTRVAEVPLKGGSLHVEMQRTSTAAQQEMPQLIRKREDWLNQPDAVQWDAVSHRMSLASRRLRDDLATARRAGLRIIGYGASISATSLLYSFGVYSLFDELVDDNYVKQGMYSPGCGLPVSRPSILQEDSNIVVVVISWQHAPKIRTRLMELEFDGRVIVPFPEYLDLSGAPY